MLIKKRLKVIIVGSRSPSQFLSEKSDSKVVSLLKSSYIQSDLNSIESTGKLISSLENQPLKAIVHLAGRYIQSQSFRPKRTRLEFEKLVSLHAGAAIQLCLGLKNLLSERSFVFLVSSTSTQRTSEGQIAYAASKGSVEVLVRYLADYLSPKTSVNAISPGIVRTPMSKEAFSNPSIMQEIKEKTPLNRIPEAADIAKIIYSFITSEIDWINGQTITADGGNTIRW